MKNIFAIIFLLCFLHKSNQAQVPTFDKNWDLSNPEFIDDFLPTEVDPNVWIIYNHYDHYGDPPVYINRPENFLIDPLDPAGILKFTEREENPPYTACPLNNNSVNWTCEHPNKKFSSGGMETRDDYLYGYFEIKCKLPHDQSLWPAFWMVGQQDKVNDCYYNEIDIFEMYGSKPATKTTNALHSCLSCDANNKHLGMNCASGTNNPWGLYEVMSCPDYTNGYHTYSVEWFPDRIVWYIDGYFLRIEPNTVGITHPMAIIANLGIVGNYVNGHADGVVDEEKKPLNKCDGQPGSLCNEMLIDYIKVDQLIWDCNTVVDQSNFLESQYKFGVKKSIALSNSTIPALTNGAPTNLTLRASDFIELKGGFEVAPGAEFTLSPTPCYCSAKAQSSCLVDYLFQDNYTYYSGDDVHFQAGNLIKAGDNYNYEIQSGAEVGFKAGNKIILKPGFEAKKGSVFHAKIEPCP